jgi:hypothetical protein
MECSEDCDVVDPHLDDHVAQSIAGYGKLSILDAASLFEQQGTREVFPFVDSDFDQILGETSSYPANVRFTEHYDLEMDIVHACPQLLHSLVISFSDKVSREAHLQRAGMAGTDLILHISYVIGVLRFHSMRDGLGLNMKGFPAEYAIRGFEQGSLEASIVGMAGTRSHPSAGPLPGPEDLLDPATTAIDSKRIHNAHDVFSVFSKLLGILWGNIMVSSKVLEATIRAVDCDCFRRLKIYSLIAAWGSDLGVTPLTCPN